jgi:hypothetical protein
LLENIAAYLFKEIFVEPVETPIARQSLCKHTTIPDPSLRNVCNNGGTVRSSVFYAVRVGS